MRSATVIAGLVASWAVLTLVIGRRLRRMTTPRTFWAVVSSDGAADPHIVPIDDLVQHELKDECVCGPRTELLRLAPDRWAVVHEALDGRP